MFVWKKLITALHLSVAEIECMPQLSTMCSQLDA
jgi:hypothetical protein